MARAQRGGAPVSEVDRSLPMVETDVLIVGGGAAGLTASMLLATYGVPTLLVSKYPKTSNLPKAHVLSIKTMEIFRELGVEAAIRSIGTPEANMRFGGYYAGFAGPSADYGREIARIGAWGRGRTDLDYLLASSVGSANLTQNRLEPLMKARAEQLAPESLRFNHSLLTIRQDPDGAVASIEDRATGRAYDVRAKYVLACDGGRVVGPQLDIRMNGHLAVATSISIHFSADLSRWARDPEVLTRIILNPDTGVPCAIVPMGPDRWGPDATEWVVHLVSFAGDHKVYDDETAVATMLQALGLPDLKPDVHVINRWPLDAVVASAFRVGRVFVLGDAAHRMPPAGGLGLNTAVQDAYNLCWKLAAVLTDSAAEPLLDSYECERRPVAEQTVATAFKSWQSNATLTAALGFSPRNSREENWRNVRRLWEEGPGGDEARQAARKGLWGVVSSFANPGISFGYRYDVGAIVDDGSPRPQPLDDVYVYEPTTRPGHSLPAAWVDGLHDRVALGDLVGNGRFILIAGEDGQGWVEAAKIVAAERAINLDAFRIGTHDGDWLDLRFSWQRVREIGPTGALLIRPDRFVAWRSIAEMPDRIATLRTTFDTVLGVRIPASQFG